MFRFFFKYIIRIRNFIIFLWEQDGTPAKRARGVALGIFCGCFPLFGFQTLLSILLAKIFKGNYVLAATFTWISNPLTYLPLYWFNYKIGSSLIGNNYLFTRIQENNFPDFTIVGLEVLKAFILGSFITGIILGIILGFLTYALLLLIKDRK
tara:strand:- start:2734 stop:3189 length:456 start_codon:yes stop_codon:yes gene_type:complete